MKHATLRQLKVFETVARNLSFTRAAEELHMTQPTASQQIKQLADIVGLPLFEQVGKRIFLTDAGCELRSVCQTIFGELERFEMTVADMKGMKKGKLRLAIITTAKYFVPRLLGTFCELYPGVNVSLKVTNREQMLRRLADNEDDLYILGQPPQHADVVTLPFLDNPLVIIAPSSHALAGEKNVPLSKLAQEPFLMREPGSGTRLATERFFAEHGITVKVRMELGSNEAIKQAVAGGLGLAVLSAHSLALEKNSDEMAILDVAEFPIRRQWYVAYRSDKQLSVVAQTFLDFLTKEGKSVAERYLCDIPGFRELIQEREKQSG